MRDFDAIVVGAGAGGLSAALHLALRGHRVLVLETNPRVGGKLNLWEARHPHRRGERPFRFDMGPSLLTLPFVFEQMFARAGDDLHARLKLKRMDPVAEFRWADGARFGLCADKRALWREVERFAPGNLAGFMALAERGRQIWDLSAETFLFHLPPHLRRGERLTLSAALNLLSMPMRIGAFDAYARLVNRHIADRRLREVLWQYATYSGASPFRAPATLACILHAEHHFGGWYIEGGMYRLAEAMAELAVRQGVEIRCGQAVRRIAVEGGRVRGVELADGQRLDADLVVCNADVLEVFSTLIDAEHRPHWPARRVAAMDPGGSGLILLLGVEGRYEQLAHHTKFMPEDYREDLRSMTGGGVPADPCIYVCASTRSDPTQAPEGCENLFVLVSAPALGGRRPVDWSVEGERYAARVIDTLERRFGLSELARRTVVKRVLTPADLHGLYGAYRGSIYGVGSNSRRDAFMRPPNRDPKIEGLYFVGGSTHPGGGLPLVALSGKIVAEAV